MHRAASACHHTDRPIATACCPRAAPRAADHRRPIASSVTRQVSHSGKRHGWYPTSGQYQHPAKSIPIAMPTNSLGAPDQPGSRRTINKLVYVDNAEFLGIGRTCLERSMVPRKGIEYASYSVDIYIHTKTYDRTTVNKNTNKTQLWRVDSQLDGYPQHFSAY